MDNLDFLAPDFVNAFSDDNRRARFHYAKVTAVASNGSLSLRISGSSKVVTGIRCLRSYVPRVNDTVVLVADGIDCFVLDALRSTNKGVPPTELTLVFSNSASNSNYLTCAANSTTEKDISFPGVTTAHSIVVMPTIATVGVTYSAWVSAAGSARLCMANASNSAKTNQNLLLRAFTQSL